MRIVGHENNITILKEMGTRIRDVRLSMNLTQEDLSVKAGVSLCTVMRIEKGNSVSIDNILNILRALDLTRNLELVVPEWQPSPEMYYKKMKKKMRVRKKDQINSEISGRMKWGDEA